MAALNALIAKTEGSDDRAVRIAGAALCTIMGALFDSSDAGIERLGHILHTFAEQEIQAIGRRLRALLT